LSMIYVNFPGFLHQLFERYGEINQTLAIFFYVLGTLICVVIPYLLGSFNTAIIVSKYLYHDDIRKYGSGNAGLTNMHRVYGKKGALYTLLGDVLKQFLSVSIGMLVMGRNGAFLAGTFCILGHIAPIYFRFKGGKGVLAAATMVLMMDPIMFLVLFAVFALVVLIFRYISLGSMMAGFVYPALVFLQNQSAQRQQPALVFVYAFRLLYRTFDHLYAPREYEADYEQSRKQILLQKKAAERRGNRKGGKAGKEEKEVA